MSWFVLLILATSLLASACTRNAAQTSPDQAPDRKPAADTLRGIIRIVGSEPATSIIIDTGATGTVTVTGKRRVLEQLSGIEVALWGERQSPRRFHVSHVAVRAVAGVPAVDGVLQRNDGGYSLLTADGLRLPLPHIPADLRSRIGARIWVAGPLDRPPDSYGVIRL